MKKSSRIDLIILSIFHFCVDFICASSVLMPFYNSDWDNIISLSPYVLLTYNCFAFLLQPFFGFLIDKLSIKYKEISKSFVFFSLSLLILGFLLILSMFILNIPSESVLFFGAIILGISNAIFHVAGSKQVLKMSNKSAFGGIYVSTGALGIGLALSSVSYVFYVNYDFLVYFIQVLVLLIMTTLSIIYFYKKTEFKDGVYQVYEYKNTKTLYLVITIICIAVAIRSFLGFYNKKLNLDIYITHYFIVGLSAFIGKAIGGLLLDYGGSIYVIIVSTVLSLVLSIFSNYNIIIYIYVLSFNLLMPVTLDLLRRCFKNKEAFAFGLAAYFLVPGNIIAILLKQLDFIDILLPITCLITGLMIGSIYYINKKELKNEINN